MKGNIRTMGVRGWTLRKQENKRRRGLAYIQRGGQVLGSVVSQASKTQRKHFLEPITKSAGEERKGEKLIGNRRREREATTGSNGIKKGLRDD